MRERTSKRLTTAGWEDATESEFGTQCLSLQQRTENSTHQKDIELFLSPWNYICGTHTPLYTKKQMLRSEVPFMKFERWNKNIEYWQRSSETYCLQRQYWWVHLSWATTWFLLTFSSRLKVWDNIILFCQISSMCCMLWNLFVLLRESTLSKPKKQGRNSFQSKHLVGAGWWTGSFSHLKWKKKKNSRKNTNWKIEWCWFTFLLNWRAKSEQIS